MGGQQPLRHRVPPSIRRSAQPVGSLRHPSSSKTAAVPPPIHQPRLCPPGYNAVTGWMGEQMGHGELLYYRTQRGAPTAGGQRLSKYQLEPSATTLAALVFPGSGR